jgi:hypothetical protein
MMRPHALSIALVGIVASAEIPAEARAQDGSDAERAATADWRLTDTRKGFCIQLLLDPAKLRDLPDGVRLISAENSKELHPVLRGVVNSQPEYKSWSPSALCFFYLTRVAGASKAVGGENSPDKGPVLGIWTVAGQTDGPGPGNVVLDLRSNDGDLRDIADDAGLDLESLSSNVGAIPREDGAPRADERRYQIRFGKTLLVWDGRGGEDTTRAPPPVIWHWQARGSKQRWITGELTLKPATSAPMVGSLRVEGKDAMSRALQASPIRYVGPSYEGGEGELRLH